MAAKKISVVMNSTIVDLPNEMLYKIFEFLPKSDHRAVALVSTRFEGIIDNLMLVETSELQINEKNVRKVRAAIENNLKKFCFKRIKIEKVENIEDLKYILKSIGRKIQYLSMRETPAFHFLRCNVPYVKHLEITVHDALKNSIDNGTFDLCCFHLLEKLSFRPCFGMGSTIKNLLQQMRSPNNTASLKHFELTCEPENMDNLMDMMMHHARTLETLELCYYGRLDDVENFTKWNMQLSCLKNIKKLCLSGRFTMKALNDFFTLLPRETPLEHLELSLEQKLDISGTLNIIIEKWTKSLQCLKLCDSCKVTDEDVMELGKFHKLSVLKISDGQKITKMGLLAGIAIDRNIFMDELYLGHVPNLDELGFRVMISRFPNLRYLTLIKLEKAITNNTLAGIWRFSTRLRTLKIFECCNITDDGMIGCESVPYSINRLRHLVKLSLFNCRYLTDRTLIEGLKLPALRELELHNCKKITVKGIKGMVKACPLLEYLSIPSTVFMDDNVLPVIGNSLKKLRRLNITARDNLTEELREHIKNVFAKLKGTTFSADCKLQIY